MLSGRTGLRPLKSRTFVRLLLVVGVVGAFLGTSAVVAGTVSAQQSTQMVSSWYGPGFEGNTTANGEVFDPSGYTAAHKTLPFDTRMIVTYQGRSVVVRINDRGPYIAGRDLDLSQGAAEAIGLTAAGEGVVDVTYTDASVPLGPYSGGAPTPEPAPEQPVQQDQDAVEDDPAGGAGPVQESVTDVQYDDGGSAADEQYAGDDVVGENDIEPNAAGDQYNDGGEAAPAVSAPSAPQEQYEDVQPVSGAAAPAAPVAPAVVPPAPTVENVEAPPLELAVPGSTVERRIELAVAAPPVDYTGPLPEEPVFEEQVPVEEPVEEPVGVASAEKPAPVDGDDEQLPSVASGLTVLPDTGGLPVVPITAGAAVLLSLLAGGKLLRR